MHHDLWQDVRYAARMFRKQPGFAAVAALTLAIGIGANTAIFSVVYGVLLKPLPFHDPERLVSVWHRAPGLNLPQLEQGAATYFTYRESNRVFEDIAVWDREEVSITGRGDPERANALWVTDGLSRSCGCSRNSDESSPKKMMRQAAPDGRS